MNVYTVFDPRGMNVGPETVVYLTRGQIQRRNGLVETPKDYKKEKGDKEKNDKRFKCKPLIQLTFKKGEQIGMKEKLSPYMNARTTDPNPPEGKPAPLPGGSEGGGSSTQGSGGSDNNDPNPDPNNPGGNNNDPNPNDPGEGGDNDNPDPNSNDEGNG